MEKPTEGAALTDLSFWALAALGCWVLAILGGNLGGLVPPDVYAFLHSSRLSSGSVAQVKIDVSALQLESARLKRENTELQQRLARSEDSVTALMQRVGTVETSLPRITEALASGDTSGLDSTVTGAIATTPTTNADGSVSFETEGGSVTVRQSPLELPAIVAPEAKAATPAEPSTAVHVDLSLPEPLTGDLTPLPLETAPASTGQEPAAKAPLGVALGIPVDEQAVPGIWAELKSRTGAVLDRLSLVTIPSEAKGKRTLIVGPVANLAAAAALCQVLSQTVTNCTATDFVGDPVKDVKGTAGG